MSTQQFDTYAKFYNLLYKDKDYTKEAEYVHQLISKHCQKDRSAVSLLDLACGTGKHLFELSALGYENLHGSDIAKPMIDVAVEQSGQSGKDIKFHNYSFQEAHNIPGKYDVVISMFSAVNYLTSFEDQLKTFKNIHGLLAEGGILLFDFWNGNAVTRDYSPVKVLRKKDQSAEIVRVSTTEIDLIKQSAAVKFNCQYFEGSQRVDEFEEVHHLHYYYFSEMFNLLKIAGFSLVHVSPFLEPDQPVTPFVWNISIVAQKS
ncbi:class I SAM-dependent methyltransferase [Paraflavitalea sp. CAU 1676]|uniref:class I SAM-dependent DNA methyltransferase n=1 Tax=Paraflavitalea sp. CAU 1676 TaxID=3032598 RepID=UPI0023D9D4C5|nr:class I SAM-dependent methyltransferase [Paraflavitalea sp. CAU 1676]MDF2187456.1 class I SAM-dependent methyltransferase [Paraflavitalea sp. CAU 1676]